MCNRSLILNFKVLKLCRFFIQVTCGFFHWGKRQSNFSSNKSFKFLIDVSVTCDVLQAILYSLIFKAL